MSNSICRSCGSRLNYTFCDLGLSPISNAFIKSKNVSDGEIFYPLHAQVCSQCWLVQLCDSPKSQAHFHGDYVYFSSYSESWLAHAREYVVSMMSRFALGSQSKVIEIASNDGYLLQYFVQEDIACLGVEPAANTAKVARGKGVQTRECFFGCDTAMQLVQEGWQVDLLLGNNVLAHVPDINDFVNGMTLVLKYDGVITLEFPHLLRLIAENQFDTIYHEHYSYLSLIALVPVFARAGLRVFDVERLPTHGGSLRLFVCHKAAYHEQKAAVAELLSQEAEAKLNSHMTYEAFSERVRATKRALLDFFIQAKEEGKSIGAYGAAAKGNTLLNYCGIGTDFIDFVADKNQVKQGRLLPGSRIPVVDPEYIYEAKPDYLLILPWNIKDEVMRQMAGIREWGGMFVVPIPTVKVFE